jgi:hypothetical protein
VDDGCDQHTLVAHAVDDAIAVHKHLADSGIVEFGDDAARLREGDKLAGGSEDLLDDGARICGESRSMYSAMASTSSSASGDQVTR